MVSNNKHLFLGMILLILLLYNCIRPLKVNVGNETPKGSCNYSKLQEVSYRSMDSVNTDNWAFVFKADTIQAHGEVDLNLFNTKIRSTKYRYSLNYCISLPIGISFFDKDTYVAFNLYIADSVPPSLIDALEIEIYKENKRVSDITKQYKNDSLWMYLAS